MSPDRHPQLYNHSAEPSWWIRCPRKASTLLTPEGQQQALTAPEASTLSTPEELPPAGVDSVIRLPAEATLHRQIIGQVFHHEDRSPQLFLYLQQSYQNRVLAVEHNGVQLQPTCLPLWQRAGQ